MAHLVVKDGQRGLAGLVGDAGRVSELRLVAHLVVKDGQHGLAGLVAEVGLNNLPLKAF